jgi:hypothetical protein
MNARSLDVALWTCCTSHEERAKLRVEFNELLKTFQAGALRPVVLEAIEKLNALDAAESVRNA